MQPDDQKLNNEDKDEKISGGQDGQPPFSEPDDVPQGDARNAQHPMRDTDMDGDEAYQEGSDAASGVQTDEAPDEDDQAIRIA